jgi:hypothetical protein
VDWGYLVAITTFAALGWFSWRWSVPYNVSIYRMVRGTDPAPTSWVLKIFQLGRWLGVAVSGLLILITVSYWIAP